MDQFLELFPLVLFIFAFKQPHDMIFIAYKEFDPHIWNVTSYDVIMMSSCLGPGIN